MPSLAVMGLVVSAPSAWWGWVLIALVVVLLAWIPLLAWPRLTTAERLMRIAVVAILIAVTVTQAVPRA